MTGSGLLIIRGADDLRALLNRPLTCPRALRLTQAQIDAYADIVEDHQWIHVDRERCRTESPFGSTIAHGFLTLSMMPWFIERTLAFEGGRMSLNYGLDRVRFIRPVIADSLLNGRVTLVGLDDHDWGWQMSWDAAITEAPAAPAPDEGPVDDEDGWQRPALAARWLTRWYRA